MLRLGADGRNELEPTATATARLAHNGRGIEAVSGDCCYDNEIIIPPNGPVRLTPTKLSVIHGIKDFLSFSKYER